MSPTETQMLCDELTRRQIDPTLVDDKLWELDEQLREVAEELDALFDEYCRDFISYAQWEEHRELLRRARRRIEADRAAILNP